MDGSILQFFHLFAHLPSEHGACMRTWGMKLTVRCLSEWCRGYQIKTVTVSTDTAACVAVVSVSVYPRGRSGGDAWGAWGERSKKIEAGGRGGLVTRCFTTPSPLLLLFFFCSPSHVSHVLLACLGNGIACLRECEFLGNCLSAPATQATAFYADC